MPRFTTSDGLSLHYTVEGDGPALLCLAGLTRDGRDFDYVAPHLPGVRLIRLDYRGRGESDWGDPADYTIPVEGRDAVELLDHLGLGTAAVLGTSRGGLIAMLLAATVKDRLTGVALNDIGPEIADAGLDVIKGYLGRNPPWKTLDEAARKRAAAMTAFDGVPESRWREEAEKFYRETAGGLEITYDPRLREAVLADGAQPVADLWPLFDALKGLPLCAIRGANSDLLSVQTFETMQQRRPDMIAATVPGRGHVPFLDEPEALDALRRWLKMLG
ncbi:hydrolase [Salipiger aestuarii]|uniref:Pimeloyl-ACP methyl ester carboxylesterase n=1 Tax=Salipiger aestuarii TaxID=568098 RepID=A0A327YSC2_9RHOB|nr:alpha/beta hydrolase [Salipiger aestuarii]EIE49477.1 hydrolase or acyltransferase [Citreicella sp. 357]KAA8610078.1 hydrolase [Salipiger aestuarii]KAA8616114.1 hydrolase [Salipiger aestuarii]KAB2543278.1 hydrolase [Salipiger aestuarii]RAK24064.1 pimeloyl-ACP methyl ester carboxylesterase [Salipiger aestuarii]